MARFRVVESDGSTHGLARTHAEALLRAGWAEIVKPRVIRMLSVTITLEDFIPEMLPPVELPNTRFRPAATDPNADVARVVRLKPEMHLRSKWNFANQRTL